MENQSLNRKEEVAAIVIKAFFAVYNGLGYGFLEKSYENALALELRARSLQVEQQAPIHVLYKGEVVGEYFADLLVESCVICELKAASSIREQHEAQLLNYLKATNIELGLLLNFGLLPKVVRKAYDNPKKTIGR